MKWRSGSDFILESPRFEGFGAGTESRERMCPLERDQRIAFNIGMRIFVDAGTKSLREVVRLFQTTQAGTSDSS